MTERKMKSAKKEISWKVVTCRINTVEKGRKRKGESRKGKPRVVEKDSTKVKYRQNKIKKHETRAIDFKNG